MILQRLATSIRKQDWFTVGIETLIVVLGVFLGIQLGNLNEARYSHKGLAGALDRLESEARLNLSIADSVIEKIDGFEELRDAGGQAISSCESSPGAAATIETVIQEMAADLSPELVDFSLSELARRDRYLDLLSEPFREAMNIYQGHVAEEKASLSFNNGLLWDQHVMKHPALGGDFGSRIGDSTLTLRVPLPELCRDAAFQRQYLMTAGFISSNKLRLERFKTRTREFLTALESEQERFGS